MGTDLLNNVINSLDAENAQEVYDAVDFAKIKTAAGIPAVTDSDCTVISQAASATGIACVAGLKGYRYTNTGDVTNSLTFEVAPMGWEVGDVVSIVNDEKYENCATIASISGTTVTFAENLPFTTIEDDDGWDAKVVYVSEKPAVGNVEIGYAAHAEGLGTKALNVTSHAEGRQTQALGQYSHAEGRQTTAQYAAHAEGYGTQAVEEQAHSEGYYTTASGKHSHAEGCRTQATKSCAHSEGENTTASGSQSHSEGYNTTASASQTHAEGNNTKATANQAHAEGNSTTASGKQSHAEGIQTEASGSQAHAEGYMSYAIGAVSHAEGSAVSAVGVISHAEGSAVSAVGDISHAEGEGTLAHGKCSHASGKGTVAGGKVLKGYVFNPGHLSATGNAITIATSLNGGTPKEFAYNVGDEISYIYDKEYLNYSNIQQIIFYTKRAQIVVDRLPFNEIQTKAYIYCASKPTSGAIDLKMNCANATGYNTTAAGIAATATGYNTQAMGNYSFAGGNGSIADGNSSFVYGSGVSAIGENSYAIGNGCAAGCYGWYYKHLDLSSGTFYLTTEQPDVRAISSMGSEPEVDTSFESGFAVGDVISYVNKNKWDMHATITEVNGNKIVVGKLNDKVQEIQEAHPNHDDWTIFVPEKPTAGQIWLGECAFAEGSGSTAINAYSHAEGGRGCLAYGQYAHAEGKHTKAAYASHSEGSDTEAHGQYSHAEGSATKATALYSHAEGHLTEASGKTSHAEGDSTKATSEYSHAEGHLTEANGIRSHAEGNETKAFGAVGHVEGNKSVVGGDYTSNTLSPGSNTSSGAYSHAEGNATLVTGTSAHAEGMQTFASQVASHAEGARSNATGPASHAEGADNTASGSRSHAEGDHTSAVGTAAHAEGSYTETSNNCEHAQGRYNKTNKNIKATTFGDAGNTLHSIGIGTKETDRKNAVEVMQNGDVYIKGIGNYDGTNPTAADVKDLAAILGQTGFIQYIIDAVNAMNETQKTALKNAIGL